MLNLNDIDLVSLVERDLGPGRRYGRWVLFHCPFHYPDRHPSFGVTNGNDRLGPGWRCFSAACGRHGGPVAWLMEYRQMTKQEARKALGGDYQAIGTRAIPALDPELVPDYPPGKQWQELGLALMVWAMSNLWNGLGSDQAIDWPELDPDTGAMVTRQLPALDYLLSRGLNEHTLKFWRIGYVPPNGDKQGWTISGEKWGLAQAKIFIPHGILIPCIVADDIWYLKVRQPKEKPHKYSQIQGGRPALYMAQTLEDQEAVVFCEGELDALLLWQEAGELAGVVTLGSAVMPLNIATWGLYLIQTQRRFIAYHHDQAGQKGGQKLNWLYPQRLEIPQLRPFDKDLTDYHRSGGDLREWLGNALVSPQEVLQGPILDKQVI